MKILAEISEGSLGLSEQFEQLGDSYKLRKSARAILLNKEGKMATQYLNTYKYHKLPGGGVDSGETVEDAMKREILEEVGCDSAIIRPVGMVIEYRNEHSLIHISYCFVAQLVGEIGLPQLEAKEIEEGQETLWLSPETVLEKLESDIPHKYSGHFILEREKSFLREYFDSKDNQK